MSRTILPFEARDISAVATRLRTELRDRDRLPGHVEMLNMLARSAGYRNFQHFRADARAREQLRAPPQPASPPVDHVAVLRLARYFGDDGRFARWPKKQSHQTMCLWVIWSRIPPRRTFRERELNELLVAEHDFGDHALLRRELCNHRMVSRPPDGSAYQRVEREPPPEAVALIRYVRARR